MEEKKSHYDIFKNMDNNFKVMLKTPKINRNEKLCYSFMNDFKTFLYDVIYNELEPFKEIGGNEQFIREYCKYIAKELLPFCNNKIKAFEQFIKEGENVDYANQYLALWKQLEDDYYAMVSFRSLKHFAYYIERGQKKKVWAKTMNIFEPFFYYANKMILMNDMSLIRASYFPGAGKTYAGNLTCAFWFGYDSSMTILRITYSDDLAKSFTKQIEGIITSEQYKKVFPKYNKQPSEVFKIHNAYELWIEGSPNANFYATTRDGQTTGKRAKLLMIDDVTKGAKEAYSIETQKQIEVMYDNDWSSRADDDDQKEILLGTMWSRFDLLNIRQQRDEADGKLSDDTLFKYTKLNANKTSAYISVPLLDYDTDETTCPLRYSTEYGRDKRRKSADKALFNAVYQQRPEEPEDLILAHRKLHTYNNETYPKEILQGDYECRAFIDPCRKPGFDYFVCVFMKRYNMGMKNGKDIYSNWYFSDVICRKKTYKLLKEDLLAKIIKHNVAVLGVEINSSSDLPSTIESDLFEKNYNDINMVEVFSTKKKEEKIACSAQDIIDYIVFPERKLFDESSEMGIAMNMLTTYSVSGNNDHDDVPDCMSMFVENVNDNNSNSIEALPSSFRL